MDREERQKKRKKKRIIKSVLWIAILAVAAWFFLFGNDVISFSGIKGFFADIFTSRATGEVATLNGTTVEDVRPLGSDVLVLSDVGAMAINKNGTETLSVQHGCSDPTVVSCDNTFLIFDRGGNRWELYNKSGLIREGSAEYGIIDGAVSSNGCFALVTASKGYHNEVRYYDKNGNEAYAWYSADNYIYKIGMKSNGKAFTIVGMDADGGTQTESFAFLFEPGTGSEPTKVSLGSGHIFYYVSYKGSNATVIGKTETVTLDDDGDIRNTFSYDGMQLEGYSNNCDRTYLVFNKFGVGRDYKLVALGSSGKQSYDAEFSTDFRCIVASDSTVTVLGSHDVIVYSKRLSQKYVGETISDGNYACASGDSIFVFGVGSIIRTEY